MKVIDPTPEFIESNFVKTLTLAKGWVKDEARNKAVLSLLGKYAGQYMMSPASTREDFFCCFPGGLAYHNLHVLKKMVKLNEVFDYGIDKESLFIVSILHEFGKVGLEDMDYYLPTNSSWHSDKGIHFMINPAISFMRIPHRSLYLAQEQNLSLTPGEYIAILLGDREEENRAYNFKEPKIATILKAADEFAIRESKEMKVVYPK